MSIAQAGESYQLPRKPAPVFVPPSWYANIFDAERQNDGNPPRNALRVTAITLPWKTYFATLLKTLHLHWQGGLQGGQKSPRAATRDTHLPSAPFGISLQPPHEANVSLLSKAGQCCFLCFDGRKNGQSAVPVPCLRPTKPRRVISRRMFRQDSNAGMIRLVDSPGGKTYERLQLKEKAYESDASIYWRLRKVCFYYQGAWKKWLPFYGIVDVQEVKFQFVGVAEHDGRFPIRMTSVNVDQVREEADGIIALEQNDFEMRLGEGCEDGWHSQKCTDMMDILSVPCIMEQVEAARQRKRKLRMLCLLRDCARNPSTANGLRTLEGMAQKSCIYDTEGPKQIIAPQRGHPYDRTDELLGLHFMLGWQRDRMALELPLNTAWVCLSLAAVWSCVLAWAKPTGDWSTAMAFGQLIVASLSILFLKASY